MGLKDTINKRNRTWKDLEQTIKSLVKEQYRLMGKVVYEPLDTELNRSINNGLDNNFEWN